MEGQRKWERGGIRGEGKEEDGMGKEGMRERRGKRGKRRESQGRGAKLTPSSKNKEPRRW